MEHNFVKTAVLQSFSLIQCATGVIDYDILDGLLFDTREIKQINPMNFAGSFPDVFQNGGFDAIVGNPPYVRIQGFPKEQIKYFSKNYKSATGNFDIYVNFIERAFSLLKPSGLLGEIIPNKFIKTDYGVGLREFISNNKCLSKVVDFGANQVFQATTYTCLLFLSKLNQQTFDYALSEANREALIKLSCLNLSSETINRPQWVFVDKATNKLLEKLENNSLSLLQLPCDMSRGSSSGDDNVFILEFENDSVEEEITRIPLFASDFSRYQFNQSNKWKIIFPYQTANGKAELLTEEKLKTNFPKAYNYLLKNKILLEKRKQFKAWYGFSAARNLALHEKAQIVVPLLANRGLFTLLPEDFTGKLCPMASGGFTLTLDESCNLKPQYILELLNSKLLFWRLQGLSNIFRGGWITCTKQYLGDLPIRLIDFNDPREKGCHDTIVELVDKIIAAKKSLLSFHTDKDKQIFERLCESFDRQIDEQVYYLYGLSDEEKQFIQKSK